MATIPQGAPHVTVNGKPQAIERCILAEVLLELGYPAEQQGIAVALNGKVIPRSCWNDQPVTGGDEIDVVGAVQGG